MATGSLIREARKAEGLTQAALARRLGITQPSVARLEAAGDEVTVATLQRALNAMGRALVLRVEPQKSNVDESALRELLALTPGERFERFEREYANTRSFATEARATLDSGPEFRPAAIARRLVAGGVDCVLVGDLAAVVRGCSPRTRVLEIAYATDSDNLDRLRQVLGALDARLRGVTDDVPFSPDGRTLSRARVLTLTTSHGWLDLIGQLDDSPAYGELRERAARATVAGVEVLIASLDDLIAMKKAVGRPKDLVAVEELEAIRRLRREMA